MTFFFSPANDKKSNSFCFLLKSETETERRGCHAFSSLRRENVRPLRASMFLCTLLRIRSTERHTRGISSDLVLSGRGIMTAADPRYPSFLLSFFFFIFFVSCWNEGISSPLHFSGHRTGVRVSRGGNASNVRDQKYYTGRRNLKHKAYKKINDKKQNKKKTQTNQCSL